MVSGGPLCPPDTIVLGAKDNGIWGVPLPLVAPGQPGQSKSLLFKRNFNENRYVSPSRPLPASPGIQNRYFLKGISMKNDTFVPALAFPSKSDLKKNY